MYDRRQVLAASGTLLTGVAGCLSTDDQGTGTRTTTRSTATPTTDPETATSTDDTTSDDSTTEEDTAELPDWEHDWYRSWDYDHALGIDPFGGTAYVTLSDESDGNSATVAVDPADGTTLWETVHDGEAVGMSYVRHNEGDDQWGVTITDETVFSVNGRADQFEWTTLHALNRETGARRWKVRRERLLGVVGVFAGRVFVLAQDFFKPEHSHDEPEPRPTSLLALDAATGEVRWEETVTAAEATATADAAGAYLLADDRLLAFAHDGTSRGEQALGTAGTDLAAATGGRYVFYRDGSGDHIAGFAPDASLDWTRSVDHGDHLAVDGVLYLSKPSVSSLAADGAIRWQSDAFGGDFVVSPDGSVLYGRSGRQADAVTAFATDDGTARWTFDPPAQNAWPAAATAGTVVTEALAEQGYTLYPVDAASGKPLARLTGVHSFAVEGLDETVLVADGSGGVRALPAIP
ncbi:PQQ-like beta-propeller repeat protein [Haloarchaeobius sp. HME9146]|uniref:PQQ-like beta-propeller repeat protein n=1 Tax=Haloarchaeobius sp. HME9146 TaxID=2978732 RepID=UPI0021C15942|nr:PQQ-like beta-propeller repeat protein [Haloarchaeobius sp. HME9146]MCT9095719.1 PQQ-like beta-propeller repeat protein [Haloarchaeobius sp. HME9146]